jgi:hypothetical protein
VVQLTGRKRSLFTIIVLCLGVCVVLIGFELLLRVTGHAPWKYKVLDRHEPTVHEPDSILGWRNKEGVYTVPPYVRGGEAIHVTFLEHGRRATGPRNHDAKKEVVILGDSFTQGWAISDAETYSWKLQQRYPSLKFYNYGTGGYGTYQSLLVLERELPRLESPALVIYGFFSHNEVRNVADDGWLRILSSYSKRAHVFLPYGSVDHDGRVVRHAPERYVALPFHENSATVAYIENLYMRMTAHGRGEYKRAVTEAILVEINRLCAKYNAKFIVTILNAEDDTRAHYKAFLERSRIPLIDCNYPLTEQMRVPGEGHPNGHMNSLWAECIQEKLGTPLP